MGFIQNFFQGVAFLIAPVFTVGAYVFLTGYFLEKDPVENSHHFKLINGDKFEKLGHLYIIALYGALVLIHVLVTIFFRVIGTQVNPVLQNNTFVKTANRACQNCIEQGAVFFPLFIYTLSASTNKAYKKQLFYLGLVFLFARVVFSIGYILGETIRIRTLKSSGMFLTLFVQLIMIKEAFGLAIPGLGDFTSNLQGKPHAYYGQISQYIKL